MRDKISCDRHGLSDGCMICCHLVEEQGKGYAKVLVNPDDQDYETAMCIDCETLLLDDGWSDDLYEFAGWKLICRSCYEDILKKHELVAEGYMK